MNLTTTPNTELTVPPVKLVSYCRLLPPRVSTKTDKLEMQPSQ